MGSLFGTDGIRGLVGEWPLTPEFFLALGKALSQVLSSQGRVPHVVIGRDTRQSGEMLQSALTAGLLEGGVQVTDLQVIPTSGVAYLMKLLGADAGAVISASHNPVEQNGIKFFEASGQKMSENREQEIENLARGTSRATHSVNTRQGRTNNGASLHELFIEGLLAEHKPGFLEGLSVLVDCSNGAASRLGPETLARAGAQVVAIHASPDGKNINRSCGSERVRRAPWETGELIQRLGVNFAMAFDGDADRVVFVDETGNLIDGDHMLGFLARYLQSHEQLLADAVVTTTMRNSGLKKFIENAGLTMHETPVGDKYVIGKLLELRDKHAGAGLLGLGGEQAGHIDLVNEAFTTGDGIRTALFVLRAYLESGAISLASFAEAVGKTPQIIASAYVGNGSRYEKNRLAEMEELILTSHSGLLRANLRYSGTEPLMRVMLESDGNYSETDLARLAATICLDAQALAGAVGGFIDILNCTHGGVINPDNLGS